MTLATDLDLSKSETRVLENALGFSLAGTVLYLFAYPDVGFELAASLGFAAGATGALLYYFLTREAAPKYHIKAGVIQKRVSTVDALDYLTKHRDAKITAIKVPADGDDKAFQLDQYDVIYAHGNLVARMSGIQLKMLGFGKDVKDQ